MPFSLQGLNAEGVPNRNVFFAPCLKCLLSKVLKGY